MIYCLFYSVFYCVGYMCLLRGAALQVISSLILSGIRGVYVSFVEGSAHRSF